MATTSKGTSDPKTKKAPAKPKGKAETKTEKAKGNAVEAQLPDGIVSLDISEFEHLDELTVMKLRSQLMQKLLIITEGIGELAKRGRNETLGYDFIGHYDITRAVKMMMVHTKVMILPEVAASSEEHWEETKAGYRDKPNRVIHTHRVRLVMRFKVVDAETGYYEVMRWEGTEQDNAGKSNQQAVSITQKYFQMKLFGIVDSDDMDPDATQSPIGQASRKSTFTDDNGLPPEYKYPSARDAANRNKNWIDRVDRNYLQTASNRYRKNPTREEANKILQEMTVAGKFNQENWKDLLIAVEVTDSHGDFIPADKLEELHAAANDDARAKAQAKVILERVTLGVEAVKKAKTIDELKKLCSGEYSDIYPKQGQRSPLVKPFIDAINIRIEELKTD